MDKQMDSTDALSRSCCCDRRLKNAIFSRTKQFRVTASTSDKQELLLGFFQVHIVEPLQLL